jgi:hypothetical protein
MLTRSLLAIVFASLMAVVATAGGCATGGDATTPPPSEGGMSSDAATDGSSMCSAPQIECKDKCVDPSTDNANCHSCGNACMTGEVCSNGKCGLTCSPPETLCSGAPYDGGVMPDAGGGTEAGPTEAGMTMDAATDGGVDGSSHTDAGHTGDAGHSGADAGKTIDAGPYVPYCANINNDPKNCGACGKACTADEMCNAGECILTCPKGTTACPGNTGCKGTGECCSTSDCTSVIGEVCPSPGGVCACPMGSILCASLSTCIPEGTCCTDADCKVTGETCPTPAGTCACPSGQSVCTNATTSLCIMTGTCCTDASCTVTGETCATSGGTCACPTGDTVCAASNSCISSTACCTASDCTPLPANVATASCTGGVCGIATCDPGWVALGTYAQGCACHEDTAGTTCATVTNEGTIGLGQTINVSGVLPIAGGENWYEFSFPDYEDATFHAKITLSVDTGSEFLFNVYDPTCASTALACGDGGSSTARTTWEISETDTNSPILTFPAVGSGGVVYVEVYRASATPTCDGYTLTISD